MRGSKKQIQWAQDCREKLATAVSFVVAARESGREGADPLPNVAVEKIAKAANKMDEASWWIDTLGHNPGLQPPQTDADCNEAALTAASIKRWMDDDIRRVSGRARDILAAIARAVQSNK